MLSCSWSHSKHSALGAVVLIMGSSLGPGFGDWRIRSWVLFLAKCFPISLSFLISTFSFSAASGQGSTTQGQALSVCHTHIATHTHTPIQGLTVLVFISKAAR